MRKWIHTLTVKTFRPSDLNALGIGIVVQERSGTGPRGPLVYQVSESAFVQSRSTEIFAVLRALEVAVEQGYSRINIRIDAMGALKSIRAARSRRRCELDETRSRICELVDYFIWVGFSLVPARKNRIALRLAKDACDSFTSAGLDLSRASDPPSWVPADEEAPSEETEWHDDDSTTEYWNNGA